MKVETNKYYCVPKEYGVLFWNDIERQYPDSTHYWSLSKFLASAYDSYILERNEELDIYTLRQSLHKNNLTLYEPEEVSWV